jgi:hypothetical protein
MLDPKAEAADERMKAKALAAATDAQIEARISDYVVSLDVRKSVANAFRKHLTGKPLSPAEVELLSYYMAGLLVD